MKYQRREGSRVGCSQDGRHPREWTGSKRGHRARKTPYPMTSVELPIALPRPTSVRSRKREEVAPSQRSALISWSRRLLWGGLLVAGVVVLVDQRHTVERAGALFVHIRWGWVGVAVALEACSILAMAQLGRCLLRVGGVRPPLRTMTEITLAGNALAVSIPGGPAVAAVWVFGQLRRHGADRTLATWVVLVSGALSSFALFVVNLLVSLPPEFFPLLIRRAGRLGPLSCSKDDQRPIAERLHAEGLVRWLGDHDSVTAPALASALGALIDQGLDVEWSERCRAVVDGRGAPRVCEAMGLDHAWN